MTLSAIPRAAPRGPMAKRKTPRPPMFPPAVVAERHRDLSRTLRERAWRYEAIKARDAALAALRRYEQAAKRYQKLVADAYPSEIDRKRHLMGMSMRPAATSSAEVESAAWQVRERVNFILPAGPFDGLTSMEYAMTELRQYYTLDEVMQALSAGRHLVGEASDENLRDARRRGKNKLAHLRLNQAKQGWPMMRGKVRE